MNYATSSPITSLTYYLTEACNLRCTYCYQEKNPARSNIDVGRATIDFLISASGSQKDIHLRFFGGEPLLEIELMQELVVYGKQQAEKVNKTIRFDMISNGTLLNKEIVTKLKNLDIEVITSVDGNNATMQANRPFYNIRQSFNGFDSQLTFAVEKKVAKVARVTVSPNQVNIVENVKHLLSIGYKSIMIALATNVPWQKETIDKIYHTLSDFYIETARAGSILPLQVTNQLLLAKHEIQHDKYEPPTSGFCGAGKEMLGVSPNGDLYPCHRFTHSGKEYLLGNVFNGIEHTKREPFLQVTTSTLHHEMCNSCLALQYCPGSCMAANLLDSGDTFYPESRHCLELRAHVYNVDRIYNELINDCPPFISFLTEAWRSKREKALMSLLSELSE